MDEELRAIFAEEARELLDVLTRGLMRLEGGACDLDQLHEVFGAAHTLKGSSRMVGARELGDAAHALEDRLAEVRAGKVTPDKTTIDELLAQVDGLERELVRSLAKNGLDEPGAPDELAAASADAPETGVRSGPRNAGARAPSATSETSARAPASTSGSETSARVSVASLRELGRTAGELLDVVRRTRGWEPERRRLAALLRRLEKRADSETESPILEPGELRILQTFVADELVQTLGRLEPLCDRLNDLGLDLRRMSVNAVVHRFERVVRDTSRSLDRDVVLEVQGADVELDRVALQELVEPVSHLLRNAVAHGVEPPEERVAMGKPAHGRVDVRFERALDSVRIVVEDDGRGLDAAALRDAAGDDDTPLERLVFEPGVSSSEDPTQLAGRGVGLDAVARAVTGLRGSVELADSSESGCRFEIQVPSDLEMLDAFVVGVAGQELLLPLDAVELVVRASADELVEHAGGRVLVIAAEPVPLLRLSSLFNEPRSRRRSHLQVVIVRTASGRIGLVVDRMLGKRRVAIRKLPPALAGVGLLNGAAVQSDGRPGFLLELDALDGLPVGPPAAMPDGPATIPRILIVDDSLSSRVLAKSLLEAVGYAVSVASSGAEALDILARESCDAAVLDFEMPGMDGLTLARRIRERPESRELPMMMLTSRGSAEDKRRGLEAGMRAYLVKGAFDQHAFEAAVRGLVGAPEVGR